MSALSPQLSFRDPFDRALAEEGPPAMFTVNAKGELNLDPFRTRDAWSALRAPPTYAVCHCLYRDRATRWVQYILVTSAALCEAHPRADITRYPDQPAALAALAALGRPPLSSPTAETAELAAHAAADDPQA